MCFLRECSNRKHTYLSTPRWQVKMATILVTTSAMEAWNENFFLLAFAFAFALALAFVFAFALTFVFSFALAFALAFVFAFALAFSLALAFALAFASIE